MKAESPSRRGYLLFVLYNLSFYMMDTTTGYFSIYLNDIGLSKTLIGLITGLAAAVALATQPVLGVWADRRDNKNRVLGIGILTTCLLYPLILVNTSFFYILFVYLMYYSIRRFQVSLNVSMSVEYAETAGRSYGGIRSMGALGYSLAMLLVGKVAGIPERGTKLTFFVYSAFCLMNLVILCFLPVTRGHNKKKGDEQHLPVSVIFKSRPILLLICYVVFYSLAEGLFKAYFSIYYTDAVAAGGLGGSRETYGFIVAVGAFIEVPFLLFSDRLVRRFGARLLLIILGSLTALRWFLIYMIPTPDLMAVPQLMNFIGILHSVTIAMTLSRMVAPQFKTTVQSLLITFQSAVSVLISDFLGGVFADRFGIRPVFLIAAGVCLAATILFPGLLLRRKDLETRDLSLA